jgi:Fe-S cluster biogenesis protein NfuA
MLQEKQEHRQRAEHIELLLQKVAALADQQASATIEELVQALLDMYGQGLTRILELTEQSATSGHMLIETFASDELLSPLLLLHGLHPVNIETRIEHALIAVRPYLKSHGGSVELLKVEKGIAYLRLQGSCHSCPSSTVTLKQTIEEAIYSAAPDLDGLQVEGVVDPPPRRSVPVTFIPTRRSKESARSTG